MSDGQADPQRPALRIVSGDPSPEEIAALVAVLTSINQGDTGNDEPSATSQWGAPSRLHRGPVHAGPVGSWWASGLPTN